MAQFNNNGNPNPPSSSSGGGILQPGWANSLPVKSTTCRVCNSKFRQQIDRELLLGHGYTDIAKRYQEDYGDDSITRHSVMNHSKKHMTLEEAALRKIVEDRYSEEQGNVDEAVGVLLGQRSMLETLMLKGYKAALSGESKIEVRDWLQIITELKKLMSSEGDIEKEEQRRDFTFFVQSVQEIVPPEQWEEIAHRFNDKIEGAKPKLLEQLVRMPSIEGEVV